MRKIFALLGLVAALGAAAEAPSVLTGVWVSDPVKSQDHGAVASAIYSFNFGPGQGQCTADVATDIRGMQMGSREMKVNVAVAIAGSGSYTLDGSTLTIKLDASKTTVSVPEDKVVLDVPQVMKDAMSVRMHEFMPAITGSITDHLKAQVCGEGIVVKLLDIDPSDPMVMTGQIDDEPVTFRQK